MLLTGRRKELGDLTVPEQDYHTTTCTDVTVRKQTTIFGLKNQPYMYTPSISAKWITPEQSTNTKDDFECRDPFAPITKLPIANVLLCLQRVNKLYVPPTSLLTNGCISAFCCWVSANSRIGGSGLHSCFESFVSRVSCMSVLHEGAFIIHKLLEQW